MYGDSAIVLSGCSAGRSINRRADVCSLFNLLNPAKFPHFERVLETLSHLLSMRVGCGSCLGCKRPRVQIPAARPSNPFEISCIGRSGSLGSLFIPAQFPHNPSRRLTGRADHRNADPSRTARRHRRQPLCIGRRRDGGPGAQRAGRSVVRQFGKSSFSNLRARGLTTRWYGRGALREHQSTGEPGRWIFLSREPE